MKVSEIISKAPQNGQEIGLYAELEDGLHDMVEYRLKVEAKDGSLGAKQRLVIHIRSVWTFATPSNSHRFSHVVSSISLTISYASVSGGYISSNTTPTTRAPSLTSNSWPCSTLSDQG